MTLLAGVFLGDLQFDCFVGVLQAAEKRRNGFAGLKIDWAVLDLDDDVVVEFSVQGVEVVVSGLGAVVMRIAPVEMMVVDKGAIENDAVMRL